MSIENQQNWLATTLGQYLQAQEQVMFDQAVNDVFGFNALQVGLLDIELMRNSRIPNKIKTDVDRGDVLSSSIYLPLTSNSIDLLLLPHVLEFSANPHQTLREAERILVPEGHIMLSGFNPVSGWGLKRLLSRREDYPWTGHFLSLLRIRDWFALLGFEVVSVRMVCHALPINAETWFQRFSCIEKAGSRWMPMMGGVYFVVAKKRVVGMRMIRPSWNKAKLKSSFVPAPSQKTDTQKIKHEQ